MVRILVGELVKVQDIYPPTESKEALAAAIVTEFPVLRDLESDLGYVSKNYYYSL